MEMLQHRRIVETVHGSFVRIHGYIHITMDLCLTVTVQLDLAVFPTKGQEYGKITEIIQVMGHGRDSQGTHRGKDHTAMEGAQFQKELGQFSKIVQKL